MGRCIEYFHKVCFLSLLIYSGFFFVKHFQTIFIYFFVNVNDTFLAWRLFTKSTLINQWNKKKNKQKIPSTLREVRENERETIAQHFSKNRLRHL